MRTVSCGHARVVCPVTVIALIVLATLAAPPAWAQQSFTESTQVTLVDVPVQVLRNGEPVRGLTAQDFQLFDGKVERPITGFDVIDLAKPESQLLSANIPPAGVRHLLLLFDLQNSSPVSIAKAQQAISESLIRTILPSDLVAVADLFRASVRLPSGTAPGLYRLVLGVTAGEASDSQSALVRVGPSGV